MAAEAARVLDYTETYEYGSAAPARELFPGVLPNPRTVPQEFPQEIPQELPGAEERIRQRQREREAAAYRSLPAISLVSACGAIFAAVLMVFVMLAQINYNEAVAETVKLNAQLSELSEQQRRLEITFESVLDMKEIETYARDVLGMSKPEAHQMSVAHSAASDRAEVLTPEESGDLRDFGSFISSLLEYFRR